MWVDIQKITLIKLQSASFTATLRHERVQQHNSGVARTNQNQQVTVEMLSGWNVVGLGGNTNTLEDT